VESRIYETVRLRCAVAEIPLRPTVALKAVYVFSRQCVCVFITAQQTAVMFINRTEGVSVYIDVGNGVFCRSFDTAFMPCTLNRLLFRDTNEYILDTQIHGLTLLLFILLSLWFADICIHSYIFFHWLTHSN
jgi:hypothetical protein